MQIHSLVRKTENKKRMTVARGGKRGKTAGRGTKGQKARAGHKIRPEIRDFIKTLPKLRGRGKNSFQSIQVKPVAVSVDKLGVFKDGEVITPTVLAQKGIVSLVSGKEPRVKILGTGALSTKLTLERCEVSQSARAVVEKAGGKIVS